MATRTCIGSKTFAIEGHEAPVEDFPVQPSRKDGLGTMCRPHWTEYTRALRRASVAAVTTVEFSPGLRASLNFAAGISRQRRARGKPEPIRTRPARTRKTEGEPIVEVAPEASIA